MASVQVMNFDALLGIFAKLHGCAHAVLLGFEEQNGAVTNVEIDEVLRLCR